jgi:hypothetical protein
LGFEASLGEVSARPSLKNKLKAKILGVWLKWQRTCLASTGPEFNPQCHKINKIKEKKSPF